jgi:NADH dehydrogenase (ubiquinone) Fe-S protein 1
VIKSGDNWNGFNILHKEASRVGALDLGVAPYNRDNTKHSKLVFILGADDIRIEDIPEDAFVIY